MQEYQRPVPPRGLRRAGGRHIRVLAVRAMIGETAWLDGRPRWAGDRVGWESGHAVLVPSLADLALAERRLAQIVARPRASAQALGDVAAWRERRLARLALAKRLLPVVISDLPALVAAHDPTPARIARLAEALLAEAICLDGLPASPAAALLALREAADPWLRTLLAGPSTPGAGLALAALVLGAIHRAQGRKPQPPEGLGGWGGRAYRHGYTAGLPADPPLALALLDDPDGINLATAYEATLTDPGPFTLPPALLRDLVSRDLPPARAVTLAEAAAALNRQAAGWGAAIPAGPQRPRWRAALAEWSATLHDYAHTTADPAALTAAGRFITAMLTLDRFYPELGEAVGNALRSGRQLPPALQSPYLAILADVQPLIWPANSYNGVRGANSTKNRPKSHRAQRREPRPPQPLDLKAMKNWFDSRQTKLKTVRELLRHTADPALVRDAVILRVYDTLGQQRWTEPALYRWVLDVARTGGEHMADWHLCNAVCTLGTMTAVRTTLGPLLRLIMAAPPDARTAWLHDTLGMLPDGRGPLRDTLARLLPYLARAIAAAGPSPGNHWWADSQLLEAALALDHARPQEAPAWFSGLLNRVALLPAKEDTYYRRRATLLGTVQVAAAAATDLAGFDAMVTAALVHEVDLDWENPEAGAAAMRRQPAFAQAIAANFVRHPHRCTALLRRLDRLAQRDAVLTPLARLEPDATTDLPEAWAALLVAAPALAPAARGFVAAAHLLGEPDGPPPGVRKALTQPMRLAGELAYLERALAAGPDTAGRAARAAGLRARLADPATLATQAAAEAAEALAAIAADTGLRAAERAVQLCYRAQLVRIAGPLPPDLVFDDNLLNAVLLALDIRDNRRLLLRLLRAYVAGDQGWAARHPANVAFLAGLAARGVDAEAWRAAGPRRVRHVAIPGGVVRLRLETDPLAVLQMGNYFDTCLSVGNGNSFSTVANAAEANKRVVYATDAAGRVIGRKLIGLSAEGGLLGYRLYSTLGGAAYAALDGIVTAYLRAFATRCRLPLADDGSIPPLFAERWYNDGAVPWDGPAVVSRQSSVVREGSGVGVGR